MTTVAREVPTRADHDESHDPAAVCWLCSDKDPRWREWRLRAFGIITPPYEARWWVI